MSQPERSDSGWVWLAYYGDWSGFAIFDTEIDALRYAVEKEMKTMRVPTQASVREYVEEHR